LGTTPFKNLINMTISTTALSLESASLFNARLLRVVLVCDVVESVRWMEQDEDSAVSRWQAYTLDVRTRIAPSHAGSVVKSTGDGLMLEFQSAKNAARAAAELHSTAARGNLGFTVGRQLLLRVGIHEAEARRDEHDLYGHGVNLAARITAMAGPGETVVSDAVRDHLTHLLDGDIEDLGACYLKHVRDPQRLYRVGGTGSQPLLPDAQEYMESLQPVIAVIPFETRNSEAENYAIGELLADGIIAQLARTAELKVISRLSTSSLRGKTISLQDMGGAIGANFVLSGSYARLGEKLIIHSELVDAISGEIIFADRLSGDLSDLFQQESEVCHAISELAHKKLLDSQVKSALTKPLPTLASYSLYLAGVSGIHRAYPGNFLIGQSALEQVVERHPRHSAPMAWLAQWLAIRSNRGLSDNPDLDRDKALTLAKRAVAAEPHSSFGLTILGLMQAFFKGDLSAAGSSYARALDLNPNEHLAWLYTATLSAWTDRPDQATEAAQKALQLSPLDPTRYYIESLAALPYLVSGQHRRAIELCKSSLRSNRAHTASYRVLAAAQVLSGDIVNARKTMLQMLELEPQMSVSRFLERYAGRDSKFAPIYAKALQDAGLPTNSN
jgi:adenylate cyclase